MSYKILTKFIKDISFEIPNAQTFTMLEKEISKYILNFDIKSNQFKDNINWPKNTQIYCSFAQKAGDVGCKLPLKSNQP